MIVNDFIIPLLLTIIIEGLIAYIFGYRDKHSLLVVMLVNIITNPVLNYVIALLSYFDAFSIYFLIPMEAAVVIGEWRILTYATRLSSKKMGILALAMNIGSYLIGVMFFN